MWPGVVTSSSSPDEAPRAHPEPSPALHAMMRGASLAFGRGWRPRPPPAASGALQPTFLLEEASPGTSMVVPPTTLALLQAGGHPSTEAELEFQVEKPREAL